MVVRKLGPQLILLNLPQSGLRTLLREQAENEADVLVPGRIPEAPPGRQVHQAVDLMFWIFTYQLCFFVFNCNKNVVYEQLSF
jgi:hypothetical protein